VRPPSDTVKGQQLARQFAEEDKALGGMESDQLVREDTKYE